MSAGMADQKNLDAEFARAIMSDGKFEVSSRNLAVTPRELSDWKIIGQNDLDYIDDNAEKLGRKKMRSDAIKRQFAINGVYRYCCVFSSPHNGFCIQITSEHRRSWPHVHSATAKTTPYRKPPSSPWALAYIFPAP